MKALEAISLKVMSALLFAVMSALVRWDDGRLTTDDR
jgi:hypothetical protein